MVIVIALGPSEVFTYGKEKGKLIFNKNVPKNIEEIENKISLNKKIDIFIIFRKYWEKNKNCCDYFDLMIRNSNVQIIGVLIEYPDILNEYYSLINKIINNNVSLTEKFNIKTTADHFLLTIMMQNIIRNAKNINCNEGEISKLLSINFIITERWYDNSSFGRIFKLFNGIDYSSETIYNLEC